MLCRNCHFSYVNNLGPLSMTLGFPKSHVENRRLGITCFLKFRKHVLFSSSDDDSLDVTWESSESWTAVPDC